MPAFRNIGAPQRMSARLEKRTPVVYDNDGWPITDGLDMVTQCINEHSPSTTADPDATIPSPRAPSPVPVSINPSSLTIDEHDEIDAPMPTTNTTASRRNNHSRRRDPGHVPRPRNAFIFFRSHFISNARALGEGQQNELSKLAGKAWVKMSEEEKRPFARMAAEEKTQHAIDYPNYVYAPGRPSAHKGIKARAVAPARRGSASCASSSSSKRKASKQKSHSPEWDSDAPDSPAQDYILPLPRSNLPPRAAARRAVQRMECLPSMSPSPGPLCADAVESKSLFSQLNPMCDEFVPTDDIPALELTPSPFMAPDSPQMPMLHVSCIPSHQETSLIAAGFRPYLPSDALNTMLPVIPEYRLSAVDNHTLNDLHYDYSIPIPIPHETTAQPTNGSSTKSRPDIAMKLNTESQVDFDDLAAVYAASGNYNGYEYYDFSPTEFDSPMDDSVGDDLYRMFVRSPSPVWAAF